MTTPKKGAIIIVFGLLIAVTALKAQQAPTPPPPKSFYRLDFAICEMDGEKVLDTRHYSLWLQTGEMGRIQSSSEAPYKTGEAKPGYRNIGVSIMSTVKETDGSPWLDLQLQISDFIPPEKGEEGSKPVSRGIDINSKAPLPLGKSVPVSSVEDPVTRHRFQVDVLTTKLR